jgi:hypothetical protein
MVCSFSLRVARKLCKEAEARMREKAAQHQDLQVSLIKTFCLYEGDEKTDLSVIKRIEEKN